MTHSLFYAPANHLYFIPKQDIQHGINWYNEQQPGLGRTFHAAVKHHLEKLRINPFYQVRYDDIHCLPL